MRRDITQQVADYLLAEKNVRRNVDSILLRYPNMAGEREKYAAALRSLLGKYVARYGPVVGGSVQGKEFIRAANDACVLKVCDYLISPRAPNSAREEPHREDKPLPQPRGTETSIIQQPSTLVPLHRRPTEIDLILGYTFLGAYPVERDVANRSRVASDDGRRH